MTKTKRTLVGVVAIGLAVLTASVALAQPTAWGRGSLRRDQIVRVQYFTAPYDGWYCVRTVDEDGTVRGWRQYDDRRSGFVSGQLGIPGLMSLRAGLAVIGPSSAPPAHTADGDTRLRMIFRTPAGVARREYAGRVPEPVRVVVNIIDGALGTSGGCEL
ncbi:MAG: hypothetical protein KF729_16885 [Sandaracinaceae bacterium]|nr:hypothetical protein [Sandaracinaceae bacterium]